MFPENLYTTSGLSILLHSVKSFPDATSCDKSNKCLVSLEEGRFGILLSLLFGT